MRRAVRAVQRASFAGVYRYEESVAAYGNAVELNPGPGASDALLNMRAVLEHLGRHAEAEQAQRRMEGGAGEAVLPAAAGGGGSGGGGPGTSGAGASAGAGGGHEPSPAAEASCEWMAGASPASTSSASPSPRPFRCRPARFGAERAAIQAMPVVLAEPAHGCAPLGGGGVLDGRVVLVERGVCPFYDKVVSALGGGHCSLRPPRNKPPTNTLQTDCDCFDCRLG